AGQLEAAEGLAIDECPGNLAIDVEIAYAELALDPCDVGWAPRIEAAGQGVGRAIGDFQGVRQLARLHHGQDGPEYLLPCDHGVRGSFGEDMRPDVIAFVSESTDLARIDEP